MREVSGPGRLVCLSRLSYQITIMTTLFTFFLIFCFFNQEVENAKVIPMDNTFGEPSSTSCLDVYGFSKLFDQSGCSFDCDLATSEFHDCLVSQMDLYETDRKNVFTA